MEIFRICARLLPLRVAMHRECHIGVDLHVDVAELDFIFEERLALVGQGLK